MAPVFYFPLLGTPTAEGNQLWFYEAGLDVPLDVWTDSDLTIPWAQPITLNAAAEADGPIYVTPDVSQKIVYKDAHGVPIAGYPVDFVAPSTIINVTTTQITVLTNAQIKALPTTPITLVAAPAVGLRVKMLGASLRSSFAAGQYTNINATYAACALSYGSDFTQWATVGIVDDVTYTDANRFTALFGNTTQGLVDLAPYLDAPSDGAANDLWVLPNVRTTASAAAIALVIAMDNNGSGALTGGNAANTLTVTVYYALESVV